MDNKISILIIDDHPLTRDGLAALINSQPDMRVVAEAEDGAIGVRAFRAHLPDITIVDLRMPGLSGVDTIKEIRRLNPKARAIVLTTYDKDDDIYRALRAGAMSYLLKGLPRQEVLETIRAVQKGLVHLPADIAARLSEHVCLPDFNSRERQILNLIVVGLSNKDIASDLNITVDGVRYHIKNILSKLNARDRAQAITIAMQRGLISLD